MATLQLEMMKISNLMEVEMGSIEINVSRAEAYSFSEHTSRDELSKYQYIDNRILYYELKKAIDEEINDDNLAEYDKDDFIAMIMNIKDRFANQSDSGQCFHAYNTTTQCKRNVEHTNVERRYKIMGQQGINHDYS